MNVLTCTPVYVAASWQGFEVEHAPSRQSQTKQTLLQMRFGVKVCCQIEGNTPFSVGRTNYLQFKLTNTLKNQLKLARPTRNGMYILHKPCSQIGLLFISRNAYDNNTVPLQKPPALLSSGTIKFNSFQSHFRESSDIDSYRNWWYTQYCITVLANSVNQNKHFVRAESIMHRLFNIYWQMIHDYLSMNQPK
jgi:hypothetical protein